MLYPDEEIRLLCARLTDWRVRAERGECAFSPFLSPREAHYASLFCREERLSEKVFFWGGCPDTERTRLFFVPSYLDGCGEETVREALAEPLSDAIAVLRIAGSGFAKRILTHRDYLGAILACGIERNTLGDIVPDGEGNAYLFCDRTVGRFLCEALTCVGSDTVCVTFADLPQNFSAAPALVPITGTVSSPRLDCMTAELTGLSREKAQSMVRTGLCELEYEKIDKADKEVLPGMHLSIRGYGKFVVRTIGPVTKKGRLRFFAERYV